MGYRHQAINLKEPMSAAELRGHISILYQTFRYYQNTGYWKPEGKDWQKVVRRNRYNIYAIERGFGIAVDIGHNKRKKDNLRMFTVYPGLNIAVMDHGLDTNIPRKRRVIGKLERLGYEIAGKRTAYSIFGGSTNRKTLRLVADETGFF